MLEWIEYDDLIKCLALHSPAFELLELEIDREDTYEGEYQIVYDPHHVSNSHSLSIDDVENLMKAEQYDKAA